jgi:TM2 domain-containing membrane protein YozV
VVQAVVPFKSGGIAFILAFFIGLVLFNGIGHMYIGKVRRGIGFLLLGCLIYSLLIVFLIFTIGVSIDQFFGLYLNQDTVSEINDNLIPQNSIDPTTFYSSIPMSFLFSTGIIYLVYWIVQAADAHRLAKKFNRHLDKEGTVLWY